MNSIPLRPYQERQVNSAIDAYYNRNVIRQLHQAATGSGKTVCAGYLVDRFSMDKTIIMVHRDELVRQSIDKIGAMNPTKNIGVVKAGRNELDADILVVSAQTLAHSKRLEKLVSATKNKSIFFVDDEAHHSVAASRSRVIHSVNPDLLVGLTATAFRSDKKALSDIYEEVVSHISISELIQDGWLADPVGIRVDIDVDLDDVRTVAGDLANSDLAKTMNTKYLNKLVVNAYDQYCYQAGRRHTIAFCVNVQHAKDLCAEFKHSGFKAEYIIGDTPTEDREKIYDRFRNGETNILVNVLVCTEGYDEPCIDSVLMCRPTKSLTLFIQCIGRALRLHPGKKNALILDFVGSSMRHNLITLPVLAGVEVYGEESIDHDATRVSEDIRQSGRMASMSDIISSIRGARTKRVSEFDVLRGSEFVWNNVGNEWMINTGNGYVTVIETKDGHIPIRIYQGEKWNEWEYDTLYGRGLPQDMALGVAETKIKSSPLTNRMADWRTRADAPTDKQINFARRLGIDIPDYSTKGDVADLIDRKMFDRAMSSVRKKIGDL